MTPGTCVGRWMERKPQRRDLGRGSGERRGHSLGTLHAGVESSGAGTRGCVAFVLLYLFFLWKVWEMIQELCLKGKEVVVVKCMWNYLNDFINSREKGREGERKGEKQARERDTHLSYMPSLGPEPATQACARPGIQLVIFCFSRRMPRHVSRTRQGTCGTI